MTVLIGVANVALALSDAGRCLLQSGMDDTQSICPDGDDICDNSNIITSDLALKIMWPSSKFHLDDRRTQPASVFAALKNLPTELSRQCGEVSWEPAASSHKSPHKPPHKPPRNPSRNASHKQPSMITDTSTLATAAAALGFEKMNNGTYHPMVRMSTPFFAKNARKRKPKT